MTNKLEIRFASAHGSAKKMLCDGVAEVIVPVPLAEFDAAWKSFGSHLCEGIVAVKGWDEKSLRIACATFTSVSKMLPAHTTDYAGWLIRKGCPNSVRAVVADHDRRMKEEVQ